MGRISVFIDNNVWDLLFKNNIDLSNEIPNDEFSLAVTKEAIFEIKSIPHADLQDYARKQIEKCNIKTDAIFGFYDPSVPPDMQRYEGFGSDDDPESGGRFLGEEEAEVFTSEAPRENEKPRRLRPSGLHKHEADISLAARATHSIVLTCNIKGALKRAYAKKGSRVIDMKLYSPDTRLYDFICSEINKFSK